jgi:hypothetical protein
LQDYAFLWTKNGVFFPFTKLAVVLAWDEEICLGYFCAKLKRMRKFCDKKFKDDPNRPDCTVDELMLAVAALFFSMIAADRTKHPTRSPHLWSRDDLGLFLIPTINSPLTAAIDHDIHGS